MKLSDLTEGTVYAIGAVRRYGHPAVALAAAQWWRRTPRHNNTDRPWDLYLKVNQATTGWDEPRTNQVGVPMLIWTQDPSHGQFDHDAVRTLRLAAARLRSTLDLARIAVDARQIREAITEEVEGEIDRFLTVELVPPRLIRGPIEALPTRPEPGTAAHINAVVHHRGRCAETVQDVQAAYAMLRPGHTLDWGQVTLAGGGRTGADEPVWQISGLVPEYVLGTRALAADGRFRISISSVRSNAIVHETEDSAAYGWNGREIMTKTAAPAPSKSMLARKTIELIKAVQSNAGVGLTRGEVDEIAELHRTDASLARIADVLDPSWRTAETRSVQDRAIDAAVAVRDALIVHDAKWAD